MKNVIVIATHISGIHFLENLLTSLQGYNKYPILLVINEYQEKDLNVFLEITNKFKHLPITIETIATNSFELGGLYTAYQKTNYEEMLLLPHSCEIVNPQLFDVIFEELENKSVAFALQKSSGHGYFWQGHMGKYRRKILDKINWLEYLPYNMYEAIIKSEVFFTIKYHSLDEETVVLFPDWIDKPIFEEKYGKVRMKIANDFIIKWKSHWTVNMVIKDGLASGVSWASSFVSQTFQLAIQHHRANQLTQAGQLYQNILEMHSNHSEALYGLGLLANQKGESEQAEQLFKAVIDIQPYDIKAWISLGNLRQTQGQLSEAIECYQKALVIDSNSIIVHNNMGYVFQQQGRLDDAIACYQKVLKVQPNCLEAKTNLTECLNKQEKVVVE